MDKSSTRFIIFDVSLDKQFGSNQIFLCVFLLKVKIEQSDADCLCSTLNKECAQLMKSTKDTEPKHIDEGIMKQ